MYMQVMRDLRSVVTRPKIGNDSREFRRRSSRRNISIIHQSITKTGEDIELSPGGGQIFLWHFAMTIMPPLDPNKKTYFLIYIFLLYMMQ